MPIFQQIRHESGFDSLSKSSRDVKLLCLQRFVRLTAFGLSAIILVAFLSSCGLTGSEIGGFLTLTLAGDLLLSFMLTLYADRLGRRRVLLLGSSLMAFSGCVFVVTDKYWVLLLASIFGVVSPSVNEIGPFRAIEESTMSQLINSDVRTDIFTWYNLIGTGGAAIGQLSCGWMIQLLEHNLGWRLHSCYRLIFGLYALLGLAKMAATLSLSLDCEYRAMIDQYQAVELGETEEDVGPVHNDEDSHSSTSDGQDQERLPHVVDAGRPHDHISIPRGAKERALQLLRDMVPKLSDASRFILIRLCMLFAIDSFASGLVSLSWLSYFFMTQFSIAEGTLGTLFFTTGLVAAISNLFAAPLARRIGLIRTMVFTHIPSAMFLVLLGVSQNKVVAILLLILRGCTSSMDQAPRQAFLANAVLDNERTAVMGMVNTVQTLAQTAAPSITGFAMQHQAFRAAIIAAGSLKITYDLALLKLMTGIEHKH